jgi:hypothetical protein
MFTKMLHLPLGDEDHHHRQSKEPDETEDGDQRNGTVRVDDHERKATNTYRHNDGLPCQNERRTSPAGALRAE